MSKLYYIVNITITYTIKPVENEQTDMHTTPLHAVVRLREPTSDEIRKTQTDLIERLHQLVAAGTLTHIDIAIWGPSIEANPAQPTDPSPIRETYLEFDHWARNQEYTLAPAFYRRTAGSLVDDVHSEVIMCPLICLGIYEGQIIQVVYPYSDGETVYTIHDGLTELESGSSGHHSSPVTSEPLEPIEQKEPRHAIVEEE